MNLWKGYRIIMINASKDRINEDTIWKKNFKFQPFDVNADAVISTPMQKVMDTAVMRDVYKRQGQVCDLSQFPAGYAVLRVVAQKVYVVRQVVPFFAHRCV